MSATDKGKGQFRNQPGERKPGQPPHDPIAREIKNQDQNKGQQSKSENYAQDPKGNYQQNQSRLQGDQGKMKRENREINKDDASE